jgi:Zn ribbon nucleic-acid-binding protein
MNVREHLGLPRYIRRAGCPNCRRGYGVRPMYDAMPVPVYECQTCGLTFCDACGFNHWGREVVCPADTDSIARLEDQTDPFDLADLRFFGHKLHRVGEYYLE